jgi:hypothetical protein
LKGIKAKLHVLLNATPTFKARTVPFAMRNKFEVEINQLLTA